MKKAFTITELLIAIAVIAILFIILVPVAISVVPNQQIVAFKKAEESFYNAIYNVAHSDKYTLPSNLAVSKIGTPIVDTEFVCRILADSLMFKSVNCSNAPVNTNLGFVTLEKYQPEIRDLEFMDNACEIAYDYVGKEIVLTSDNFIFQTAPNVTYNFIKVSANNDNDKYENTYKIFCTGIVNKKTNAITFFGYGVKYNGDIVRGARAKVWAEKPINGKI